MSFSSLELLSGASVEASKKKKDSHESSFMVLDKMVGDEGTTAKPDRLKEEVKVEPHSQFLPLVTLQGPSTPDPLVGEQIYHCNRCKKEVSMKGITAADTKTPIPLPYDHLILISWCPACKTAKDPYNIHFQPLKRSWGDIVKIVVPNLEQIGQKGRKNHLAFRCKEDICAFISDNWERLCFEKNSMSSWSNGVLNALKRNPIDFACHKKTTQGTLWYRTIHKENAALKELLQNYVSSAPTKKRKRAISKDNVSSKKQKTEVTEQVRSSSPPEEMAIIPVMDPLPPIPVFYTPTKKQNLTMRIEKDNSAPQIKIFNNGLACSNQSGYRMSRGSYPILNPGTYYYEVALPKKMPGNIRLGWSTEKGDLQGPVGYDKFSYSYRNATGQKFHRARGKTYGKKFKGGDVIGALIKTTEEYEDRMMAQDLPAVKKAKSKWARQPLHKPEAPQNLKVMVGSEIMFFVNGKSQGVAFSDLIDGKYYPAVSLFMGASCDLHFSSQDFKFPIRSYSNVNPISTVVPKEHPPDPVITGIPAVPHVEQPANTIESEIPAIGPVTVDGRAPVALIFTAVMVEAPRPLIPPTTPADVVMKDATMMSENKQPTVSSLLNPIAIQPEQRKETLPVNSLPNPLPSKLSEVQTICGLPPKMKTGETRNIYSPFPHESGDIPPNSLPMQGIVNTNREGAFLPPVVQGLPKTNPPTPVLCTRNVPPAVHMIPTSTSNMHSALSQSPSIHKQMNMNAWNMNITSAIGQASELPKRAQQKEMKFRHLLNPSKGSNFAAPLQNAPILQPNLQGSPPKIISNKPPTTSTPKVSSGQTSLLSTMPIPTIKPNK